jgi:flagellar basal-body rod protein FlgC
MGFLDALNISASGMSAQQIRMNVISSNLANINTTRTPQGGPYQKKDVVFASDPASSKFKNILDSQTRDKISGVKVAGIVTDSRPPLLKYDPSHPDANEEGYVATPNINVVEEMVNVVSATRSYEAGVAAINATKTMALKALEIGR